jgi:hypothetical protein
MYWKKFKRNKDASLKIALTYDANSITVMGLHLSLDPAQSRHTLCYIKEFKVSDSKGIAQDLKQNGLDHAQVTLVLSTDYQIMLVDIPEQVQVENEVELRRYLSDMVESDLSDMILDYIEIPQKKMVSSVKKYYIISAKKQIILEKINVFKELGFKIDNIQIPESALSNLITSLEDSHESLIYIYATMHKTYILLVKDTIIYMMRTLELGFQNDADSYRELGDEIQKTLVYCNSHLAKFIATRVVLASLPVAPAGLLSTLSDILGLPGRTMKPEEVIAFGELDSQEFDFDLINLGGLLPKRIER